MQFFITLPALTAIALVLSGAAPREIGGRYCGTAWSGGRLVEVVTILDTGPDGLVGGSYEFADNGQNTPGTLREFLKVDDDQRTLVWVDKYGTGQLIVAFDAGRESFSGTWGELAEAPSHRWDGQLCDRVASG